MNIDRLTIDPKDIIDTFIDNNMYNHISAGFYMEDNGVEWGHIDTLENAKSWLESIEEILDGVTESRVWAWEESRMNIKRFNNVLIMEDIDGNTVFAKRVTVDLFDFVNSILREANKWSILSHRIHESTKNLADTCSYYDWVKECMNKQEEFMKLDPNVQNQLNQEAIERFCTVEQDILAGNHEQNDIQSNDIDDLRYKLSSLYNQYPLELRDLINRLENKYSILKHNV